MVPYNSSAAVTGETFDGNGDTSPAMDPAGWYDVWIDWMTITVDDQWTHQLDPIFNGASVSEEEEGFPINQSIENGQYTDPVFAYLPGDGTTWDTEAIAAEHLDDNVSGNQVQNFPVQIGGVSLPAGINHRGLVFSSDISQPGVVDITVTWPAN